MRIGIDLGGTKIELVVFADGDTPSLRKRIDTPSDYAGVLDAVAGLVAAAERIAGVSATVGVGMPGALSHATGRVKNSNSQHLMNQPVDRDLSDRLGRPVRIANDADCFTLSEATDGAAAGAAVVFGVILGTGVGGGVVVHGRLLDGANAIAGEWGHNPLPWPDTDEFPGSTCYCGKRGCVETFLSGPALAADYRNRGGGSAPAREVVARAEEGDALAEATLQRYETRLARGLAGVINVLDPHVIVLGGGLSNVQRLYRNVPALWGQYIFSDTVSTRLVPPRFGDSSGVRGAARLWPDPGAGSRRTE